MITAPVSGYAAAVRAALADVPEPDRSELLEDLEDHLTEVAGESDEPLETRLGTPESYAAELYAAYLQRPDPHPTAKPKRGPSRLLDLWEERVAAFHTRMAERLPWYETARADFRPAWWLLRGYLLAFVLWTLFASRPHYRPWNTFDWFLLLAVLAASVALGYRMREGRLPRSLALLPLGAGLIAAVSALLFLTSDGENTTYVEVGNPGYPNSELANIYPYTKDGKPLKDVLLYDQNGRPIQLDYSSYGYELVPAPVPQIPNSYPLPLCTTDPFTTESTLVPTCPTSDPDASPSDISSPSPSPTASPESTPSTSPSASPTSPESTPTD